MSNSHMSNPLTACFDGESADDAQPVEVTDTTVSETPDTQPVEETPEPTEPEPLTFTEADVEQRIAERLATAEREWADKLAARDSEVATIRAAHDAAMINVTLVDVIKGGDAVSVEQVMAILRPCTSMIAGQPSVQIEGYHMTPREAVQWMRGQVDRYGNLFKSNVIPGLGSDSHTGLGRSIRRTDVRNMSAGEYRQAKKDSPGSFGFGGVG